jgi:hypothetical protein
MTLRGQLTGSVSCRAAELGADQRGGVHRSGCFHDAKRNDAALKDAWPAIVGWNVGHGVTRFEDGYEIRRDIDRTDPLPRCF